MCVCVCEGPSVCVSSFQTFYKTLSVSLLRSLTFWKLKTVVTLLLTSEITWMKCLVLYSEATIGTLERVFVSPSPSLGLVHRNEG